MRRETMSLKHQEKSKFSGERKGNKETKKVYSTIRGREGDLLD